MFVLLVVYVRMSIVIQIIKKKKLIIPFGLETQTRRKENSTRKGPPRKTRANAELQKLEKGHLTGEFIRQVSFPEMQEMIDGLKEKMMNYVFVLLRRIYALR